VAITDTNCNPDVIDYVVPGNDDAIKSVALFSEYFANAISGSAKRSDNVESPERDASLEKEILTKYEQDIDLKEEKK
jgi:small subunit ribosomal protein S2